MAKIYSCVVKVSGLSAAELQQSCMEPQVVDSWSRVDVLVDNKK